MGRVRILAFSSFFQASGFLVWVRILVFLFFPGHRSFSLGLDPVAGQGSPVILLLVRLGLSLTCIVAFSCCCTDIPAVSWILSHHAFLLQSSGCTCLLSLSLTGQLHAPPSVP